MAVCPSADGASDVAILPGEAVYESDSRLCGLLYLRHERRYFVIPTFELLDTTRFYLATDVDILVHNFGLLAVDMEHMAGMFDRFLKDYVLAIHSPDGAEVFRNVIPRDFSLNLGDQTRYDILQHCLSNPLIYSLFEEPFFAKMLQHEDFSQYENYDVSVTSSQISIASSYDDHGFARPVSENRMRNLLYAEI